MTTVLAHKVTIVKKGLAAVAGGGGDEQEGHGPKEGKKKKSRAETRLCSTYFTGREEKWKSNGNTWGSNEGGKWERLET